MRRGGGEVKISRCKRWTGIKGRVEGFGSKGNPMYLYKVEKLKEGCG